METYLVRMAATAGFVGVVGAGVAALLGNLKSKGDGSSSNFLYGSCRQHMYLHDMGFTVVNSICTGSKACGGHLWIRDLASDLICGSSPHN